jgi:hypothetical protein
MTTRRFALALLLPLATVAGCDQVSDKEIADPQLQEEEMELPGSHEGDDCSESLGETQACSDADDALGEEICREDPETYEARWSGCYVDECAAVDATQACTDGEHSGTQYCFEAPSGKKYWGECIAEVECTAGETRDCGGDIGFDLSMTCYIDDLGVPRWNWWACDTPLVLSFDGRAPAFAAPSAAAAAFDITGAGVCLSPDWPTAATPWLALDRDHNGTIDGGHELFGNGTRMASGRRAEQGFDALSDLDSDGDGRITPADAAWAELVLWADHDGDRLSSGWELLPLESYGVESIDLDYVARPECDARGNCGNERAAFTFRDGGAARTGEVVDVYVACD